MPDSRPTRARRTLPAVRRFCLNPRPAERSHRANKPAMMPATWGAVPALVGQAPYPGPGPAGLSRVDQVAEIAVAAHWSGPWGSMFPRPSAASSRAEKCGWQASIPLSMTAQTNPVPRGRRRKRQAASAFTVGAETVDLGLQRVVRPDPEDDRGAAALPGEPRGSCPTISLRVGHGTGTPLIELGRDQREPRRDGRLDRADRRGFGRPRPPRPGPRSSPKARRRPGGPLPGRPG